MNEWLWKTLNFPFGGVWSAMSGYGKICPESRRQFRLEWKIKASYTKVESWNYFIHYHVTFSWKSTCSNNWDNYSGLGNIQIFSQYICYIYICYIYIIYIYIYNLYLCIYAGLSANWTHGVIAQWVRASERNSVVVGSDCIYIYSHFMLVTAWYLWLSRYLVIIKAFTNKN